VKAIFIDPPLTGTPAGAVVVMGAVVLGAVVGIAVELVVGAVVDTGGTVLEVGAALVVVVVEDGLVQAVTRPVTSSKITRVIPKNFANRFPTIVSSSKFLYHSI
jgi:hypothetical protein